MFSRSLFRSSLRAARGIPLPRTSRPLQPLLRSPAASPARTFEPKLQSRFFSQTPLHSARYRPNAYYRFDPDAARSARPLLTVESLKRGAQSPKTHWVLAIAAGGGVIFYVSNLETVPVSGRRRFNCFSDEAVEEEGQRMYEMIMQQHRSSILPDWDPRVKMVQRVMQRLIPASGLEHVPWEVHVIQSNEANAFVIPGGKVFVYSGILPIAKTDDGLAAILGHEIAHNLARHAAESMSGMVLLTPLRFLFIALDTTGYTMGLGRVLGDYAMELGISRPASRKQESEADFLGLMMMARSCYNPEAAVGVWQRMEEANRQDGPEWLSTHPSNKNRIEMMKGWMDKANEAREESDCQATIQYSRDFQNAFGRLFM